MSQRLAVLLAAMAVLGLTAALISNSSRAPSKTPSRPVTLRLITGGSSPFWQRVTAGAEAAAEQLDVRLGVVMLANDEDVSEQNEELLALTADPLDGIAISPLDPERQTMTINRLSQRAIVVTYDSDAPLSARSQYIGASNFAAGKQVAELVGEAAPEGGEVVLLVANRTKHNTQQRLAGFEEGVMKLSDLGGPALTIAEVLIDEGDEALCAEQLESSLEERSDLSCVVGLNAYHGPIAAHVLREAGRLDGVKIIAFDDNDGTLEAIEAGDIFATVAQDPYYYGYESVRCLKRLCWLSESERPIPGSLSTVTVATQPLKREDLEAYREVQEKLSGAASE